MNRCHTLMIEFGHHRPPPFLLGWLWEGLSKLQLESSAAVFRSMHTLARYASNLDYDRHQLSVTLPLTAYRHKHFHEPVPHTDDRVWSSPPLGSHVWCRFWKCGELVRAPRGNVGIGTPCQSKASGHHRTGRALLCTPCAGAAM